MPGYGRYKSIRDYLETRARERDTTVTQMSEELLGKRSYLSSIASEQFTPSMERCREIAAHLDDDPEIMLTLAGYMEPPPEQGAIGAAVARQLNTLSDDTQRAILQLVESLTAHGAAFNASLEPNQVHVALPDGRTFVVDLDANPDEADESMLRVTLRAALNATLNRR